MNIKKAGGRRDPDAAAPEPGELVRLLETSRSHTGNCAGFRVYPATAEYRACDCWLARALDLARSQEAALIGLADLSEAQEQRIRELERGGIA